MPSLQGGCAEWGFHTCWTMLCILVLPHWHSLLFSYEGTTLQQLWSLFYLGLSNISNATLNTKQKIGQYCFSRMWKDVLWISARYAYKVCIIATIHIWRSSPIVLRCQISFLDSSSTPVIIEYITGQFYFVGITPYRSQIKLALRISVVNNITFKHFHEILKLGLLHLQETSRSAYDIKYRVVIIWNIVCINCA